MKVWITKYALSTGILECEAEQCSPRIIKYGARSFAHGEGKDWHITKAGALARAALMRTKKLASLRASIRALEAKSFDA